MYLCTHLLRWTYGNYLERTDQPPFENSKSMGVAGPVEHIRTYGLVRTKFLTKEVYVILFFTPLLKVPNSNLHDLEVFKLFIVLHLKYRFSCLFIMQSSSKVKIMSGPRLNAFHRACHIKRWKKLKPILKINNQPRLRY